MHPQHTLRCVVCLLWFKVNNRGSVEGVVKGREGEGRREGGREREG